MFRIMVVEDDIKIRELIAQNLSRWNYEVLEVDNFIDIIEEFIKFQPQLVLMDINLPSYDGFYWCSKIRQVSKIPIIFISSRSTNMDIIMAINMGGDDFVQKPFSMEILLAKINAIIRRTYSYTSIENNVIEHKGALLNLMDNTLIYKDERIELTKNEFRILSLLMKNRGRVIDRDKIMRVLWEDESFVDDNTLTVNINRLRRKLTNAGLIDFIDTRKGQGYIVE